MRTHLLRSVWPLVGLLLIPNARLVANAQQVQATPSSTQIVGKEKTELLTAARSQYYNLRTAGLKSFGCTVELDWDAFMARSTGSQPRQDDPTLKFLNASRLTFTDNLDDKPDVKWTFAGSPPADDAEATASMTNGMVEVVSGFLQAWTPSQDGSLLSLTPRSFKRSAGGFQIDDAGGTNVDRLTLNKNFLITHATTRNKDTLAETDFSFTKMPEGMVLTNMIVDDQIPPSAPATHVTMGATYATVDSFLLPENVTVSVKNVATFNFKLTHCIVERQP